MKIPITITIYFTSGLNWSLLSLIFFMISLNSERLGKEIASAGQIFEHALHPTTQLKGFFTTGTFLSSSHSNTLFLQKLIHSLSPIQASVSIVGYQGIFPSEYFQDSFFASFNLFKALRNTAKAGIPETGISVNEVSSSSCSLAPAFTAPKMCIYVASRLC